MFLSRIGINLALQKTKQLAEVRLCVPSVEPERLDSANRTARPEHGHRGW